MAHVPPRPRSTLLSILLLWTAFYASFTLLTPPLLDDADSVHAEVAREMLLRHDYITLYANGIRYLEKAPLLYWSMAASMRLSQLFGATSPTALAIAARIPLSLTILALALLIEAFARRLFTTAHAGLFAALITLSSFGIFLFTRITIPDAMVCLWTTLSLYAFYRTEQHPLDLPATTQTPIDLPATNQVPQGFSLGSHGQAEMGLQPLGYASAEAKTHLYCYLFAAACALNVLTKGLIGIVFPIAIVLLYLLLTRGPRNTLTRLSQLHPLTSLLVFLAVAAPWHILAGLANPTQGHPTPFHFVGGHWQVPLPTDGNVRGWFWFYFMNEHLLRYLNLRVPHDYDTAPLWLFWGLCLIWLMPWSTFLFKAISTALPWRNLRRLTPDNHSNLLLILWAALPLLFFSLSTRQEYYVLPALPAMALLIAGWLTQRNITKPAAESHRIAARRCTQVLFILGTLFAIATIYFLIHTRPPLPNADLATLLQQNPGDYALSMGHFLDLNAQALGLFRVPLAIAAIGLFVGPLASLLLRNIPSLQMRHLPPDLGLIHLFGTRVAMWQGRKSKVHAANLALAAGAFTFLLAAHLGLQTFAPVLTSAQLARTIAPQVHPDDLIVIHGEYESGSTLGFYLQRPNLDSRIQLLRPLPNTPQFIHILEGRSSNLWYGSFFPDAPHIFETPTALAAKWSGPQRIFLWQSLTDPPNQLPPLPSPVYILVKSGGKEIVSNQPNR